MYENIVCGDCGEPNRFDCVIPSEVWNACCADADILCFRCIDRRVKAAGLACECEFYAVGEAVKSKLYGESFGSIAYLTAERDAALARVGELEGLVREARQLPGPSIERIDAALACTAPAAAYCAPCGKEHGFPPCQPV